MFGGLRGWHMVPAVPHGGRPGSSLVTMVSRVCPGSGVRGLGAGLRSSFMQPARGDMHPNLHGTASCTRTNQEFGDIFVADDRHSPHIQGCRGFRISGRRQGAPGRARGKNAPHPTHRIKSRTWNQDNPKLEFLARRGAARVTGSIGENLAPAQGVKEAAKRWPHNYLSRPTVTEINWNYRTDALVRNCAYSSRQLAISMLTGAKSRRRPARQLVDLLPFRGVMRRHRLQATATRGRTRPQAGFSLWLSELR